VRIAWIAVGCAIGFGCDKVLGLATVDQPIDAPIPTHFTVDYTLRTVAGSAGGVASTDALYDPSAFVVTLPDGTQPAVAHLGTGMYAFDAVADSYEIQLVQAQDAYLSRIDHGATELHLLQQRIGRPDAVLPTMSTTVDASGVTRGSNAVATRLYSTGVFANVQLQGSGSADWKKDASGVGLVDYTRGDRLYFIVDTVAGLFQPTTVTSALELDSVAMQDGVTTTLAGSAAALPAQCLIVDAALADAEQAIVATQPTCAGASCAGSKPILEMVAMPGDFTTSNSGLPLVTMSGISTNISGTQVSYSNPIEGTPSIGVMAIIVSRQILAPNGAFIPFTFAGGYLVEDAPHASGNGSCSQKIAVATGVLGQISDVTIGGVLLDRDGAVLPLDLTADPEVTWTVSAGAFDYYNVKLDEVIDAIGATVPALVDQVITISPHATFAREHLIAGHRYVIQVVGYLGVPLAAQGDFRSTQYPAGLESYIAGSFDVALPRN
jgi:hypothetical protein